MFLYIPDSYDSSSQSPGYSQPPSSGHSGGGYGGSGAQTGGYGGSGSHQQPSQPGRGHYNQPPSYSSPPPQSFSQQSHYGQGGVQPMLNLRVDFMSLIPLIPTPLVALRIRRRKPPVERRWGRVQQSRRRLRSGEPWRQRTGGRLRRSRRSRIRSGF